MIRWMQAASLSVALMCLALPHCAAKKAEAAAPPPAVLVATLQRRDVAIYIDSVASLDGYVNAEIRARVKGYLKSQSYKDGSRVKRGDILFSIEPADYLAAVNVARATLARATAAQVHDKLLFDRDQALFESGALSKQDLEAATANLSDANGQVQSARAQLDQAALNLSYTRVASPIDGVAGLALVRVGNLVGQEGPTLLTTVSQLQPMRVNFPMAEGDFLRYRASLAHLEIRDLEWANVAFASLDAGGLADVGDPGVELVMADGSTYAHRGVVVAVDRQIDPSTGTIMIQALFPDPDGALRPGSYGQVRIRRSDEGHDVLVVPEKALISVQGSDSLAVVGPDDKIQLRHVELGPSVQGVRVVKSGVAEGERIVVEGVQKVAEGALVDPKPAPPAASASASGSSGTSSRPSPESPSPSKAGSGSAASGSPASKR